MYRNIPIVTRWLLIVNVVAYFLFRELEYGGSLLPAQLALWPAQTPSFRFHQLLTHLFMHGNFYHLLFNMFALWFFGCDVERQWGQKKYLFYYAFCGLGAAVSQLLVCYFTGSRDPMIGASGAIFGVLLAYAVLFPNRRIGILALPVVIIIASSLLPNDPVLNIANKIVTYVFIFLIIAMAMPQSGLGQWFARNIKYLIPVYLAAKWIVAGYIAIELLFMYLQMQGDDIAHMAHLGGVIFGMLPILYWEWQRQQQRRKPDMKVERGGRAESDMDYNARKKQNQEVIDRILDKIRKSGYDSLTKEEKQTLFEASRER